MSRSTSNLFTFLGKPVKDEYDRVVGTMASFLVTPGGRVNGVFIEHSDGSIKRYSRDQIKTHDGEAIVFSPLKMKASNFCTQIPLLWRKTQAIKDLNEQKKIPENMYDDLYSSFEGALNQLKTEAEETITEIDKQVAKCTQRVKDLNSALINLEIEREIGQIGEESYQTAIEMVKNGLARINAEKSNFEALQSQLSNMLLGETAKENVEEEMEQEKEDALPSPPSDALDTSLPKPPESSGESPVVVYVKNADNQNP
ncbi:MAG: CdvA-like protein [Candidatus Bathyarchaeota archaeon]|nr:CdvA-like protein [Candidatus Bathyarchaeota archaeon]